MHTTVYLSIQQLEYPVSCIMMFIICLFLIQQHSSVGIRLVEQTSPKGKDRYQIA